MRRILIIGAGFCGAMLAAQLLRQARGQALHICLANRGGSMGRGLAYGTQSPLHLLNVPAGNMSAFPDQPDHFLRFAQARDRALHAGSFVARSLYGDYLETVLAQARAGAVPGLRFEHLHGDVVRIDLRSGHAAEAHCADGRRHVSDQIVLAFGHFPARDPLLADPKFFRSALYLRDPWGAEQLGTIASGLPILLLGSGLTAIDTALTVLRQDPGRRLVAVSRHGLLPQAHRSKPRAPDTPPSTQAIWGSASTVREQMRGLRGYVRQLEEAGGDWRDALVALRPVTAALWHAWTGIERRRFLRHVQAYWDNHRHRLAPPAAERIDAALATGQLQLHAARVTALDGFDEGGVVTLRQRGQTETLRLRVAAVINCTGACGNPDAVDSPLVAQLLADGLVRLDPLQLGLDLAPSGATISADGSTSPRLFYVGPWLRARDWEATAVPELRQYVSSLSEHLLAANEGSTSHR